jgi:hypothetical protein
MGVDARHKAGHDAQGLQQGITSQPILFSRTALRKRERGRAEHSIKAGSIFHGAENPFSRLREKVAAKRPDEGTRDGERKKIRRSTGRGSAQRPPATSRIAPVA